MGHAGGHWLVRMEWSQMVSVSATVNLPLHHKVQKFSSGTGSPGKRTVKWLWCGVVMLCTRVPTTTADREDKNFIQVLNDADFYDMFILFWSL